MVVKGIETHHPPCIAPKTSAFGTVAAILSHSHFITQHSQLPLALSNKQDTFKQITKITKKGRSPTPNLLVVD